MLLNHLARVNLIAGKNNTGKTALLEAIHIQSYPENCKLLFDIHSRRGMAEGPPYDSETAQWLFYDRQAAYGFELISQDEGGTTRTLEVRRLDRPTALQRFPELEPLLKDPAFGGAYSLIVMKTEEKGRQVFAVGTLTQHGITFSGKEAAWRGRSIYLGSAPQAGESVNHPNPAFRAPDDPGIADSLAEPGLSPRRRAQDS